MNRPNGKYCTAPGSLFPFRLWPECYLPSTSVGGRTSLCHSARGQGFCFSTQCMFSALVSSDAWMIRQTVKTLPVLVSVRTLEKQKQRQGRQRDRGGRPWKTSRRWSPSRPSWRQTSLFNFPGRIYWVKFCVALPEQVNGGEGVWGGYGLGMERKLGVCHFLN